MYIYILLYMDVLDVCDTLDGRNPASVHIENIPCFIGFHIYIYMYIHITGG